MIDRLSARCVCVGLVTLLAAVFGGAPGARAQGTASPGDKAAAEALYDRGIALMRDGKTAEACVQFEQSQAIESGIGTMLHLAECYEQLGRTASAWALFREAASSARFEGQTDRVKWGNERASALAPKLSMLTLQVPQQNQVQGFVLTRDGSAVHPGLWNVPVPVDPGVHKLRAHAPGYEEWSAEVTVGSDAASVTQSVPALVRRPEPLVATVAPAPLPAGSSNDASSRSSDAPRRSSRVQRIVGLAVGGVGVGGLVLGGVFGLSAMSKKGDVDDCAKNPTCLPPTGEAATRSTRNSAKLSNIFMVGGAVLAATGVVLYLTAGDHEEKPTVAVGFGPAGARLTVGGAF